MECGPVEQTLGDQGPGKFTSVHHSINASRPAREYVPDPRPSEPYAPNIGREVGTGAGVVEPEEGRTCLRTSKQVIEPEHWEKPIPVKTVSSESSQSAKGERDRKCHKANSPRPQGLCNCGHGHLGTCSRDRTIPERERFLEHRDL